MATVDLGKISFTQKGTWGSGTAYVAKDVVQYTDDSETSSYVAVASSTGQAPATNGTINTSYWALFAKGASVASNYQSSAWASGTAYQKGAVVQFTDSGILSTYLAVADSTGQQPSTSGTINSSYWAYLAKGTAALGLTVQSVQTSNFSALAGNIYPVNTTSGVVTATLPASPSVGDEIGFLDYARTFGTNNFTLAMGSLNFQGGSTYDPALEKNGGTIFIRYIDATQGWIPTFEGTVSDLEVEPLGQVEYTTPGSYTFNIPANVAAVSVVCVGAGGGNSNGNSGGAGGGGALAYRNAISVSAGTSAAIVVGAGKAQGAGAGGDSSFTYSGTTTTAGGGAAGTTSSPSASGGAGGSASGTTTAGYSGGAGGGDSGNHGGPGGGGAGGYSGTGGAGASKSSTGAVNGAGGSGGSAGGGGSGGSTEGGGGGGGGVGLLGEGASGSGGVGQGTSSTTGGAGGGAGSGGSIGGNGSPSSPGGGDSSGGNGGNYGGGAGGPQGGGTTGVSAGGAVRVIWGNVGGSARAFPSTNTGDQ